VPHDAKPGAAIFSEPAPERGKVGPPSKTASKASELLALDSTELAAMACRLGSAILVKAGQKRYGDDAVMLALDDKETEEVTRIGSRVIEKYLPKMEPEWALAITLGIIYTSKVLTLEGARDHGVPVATMKAALEKHQAEELSKAQQVAANIAAQSKAAEGAQA